MTQRQRAARIVGYVYAAIGCGAVAWSSGWMTLLGVILLVAAHHAETHVE